ncbi:MAG: response regulator transcription factor [Propionibacteriaceae bacterium]|jgi:DNA-binding NarL/FixJ family response regulator|nr:response regulator transcription factor [Propionibacteriaceae bacterium]
MIRVLVVDDHPVVRQGLIGVIESEADLTVVGQAADGLTAVTAAAELAPDVVLMDLKLPGLDGVEATKQIVTAANRAGRPTQILIVTVFESDDNILDAISAGAQGYVLKAAPTHDIIGAIRDVASGHTVLAPSLAASLARRSADRISQPKLSDRESEILPLIAEGLSNSQIARRLMIGESTVKTHIKSLFAKLEVSDRTHAVTRAISLGLLVWPPRSDQLS